MRSDVRVRGWGGLGLRVYSLHATRSGGPCRRRAGPVSCAVPGPTLRAQVVAQARHYVRAVPGTGTKRTVPCRASAVLFSAVPGPARRVSAIWPTIGAIEWHGRQDVRHINARTGAQPHRAQVQRLGGAGPIARLPGGWVVVSGNQQE